MVVSEFKFVQMSMYVHRNKNPWCKMIALEFCKAKSKNPLIDVERGKISKEQALEILETGYRVGVVKPEFYEETSQKLKNL